MSAARRVVKAVVVRTTAGDRLVFANPSRVFTNADGSVTVMRGSNTPAIAKIHNVKGSPQFIR